MTSVKDFCKRHEACQDGYRWGLKYETMERVFAEGDDSGYIIWAVTREGVLSDRELRLFACFCARQNWHLLTDDRSKRAIETAERCANELATDDDLADARAEASTAAWIAEKAAAKTAAWPTAKDAIRAAKRNAARAALWATARNSAWAAARDAARATAWAAAKASTWDAAWASARNAQVKWLRENTNPDFGAGLEESK